MKRRRHQHERRRKTRANRKPAPATARDDDAAPGWPGLKVALHWLDQQDDHDVLATMMLLNRLGMLNARPAGSPEVTEWMLEHLAVPLAGGGLLRTWSRGAGASTPRTARFARLGPEHVRQGT